MVAIYNGDKFEAYLKPTNRFQPGVSKINGMKMRKGNLYKNDVKVENAETILDGLTRFLVWLNSVDNSANRQIVLVMQFFVDWKDFL